MPDGARPWIALNFDEPVKNWVREYAPSLAIIGNVRDWIRRREVDPFDGAYPVAGMGDRLYYGVIPGTLNADGRVVTCTFWVLREDGIVRCSYISTVSWPT